MTKNSDNERHAFFDVERYRKIHAQTTKPMGRWGKTLRMIIAPLEAIQGFLILMALATLPLATALGVIMTVRYGPFAFLGLFGGIIGGLTLIVERRVGKSIQIADYNFLKRTLATGIAFLAILAMVFLLIYLSKLPLPHLG